ncbi:hypothetical protein BOTBODRAFT_392526 [Botryobasidium botryosum FD-172 SS1]|uniref:Uncharacterized protein n=1 Tax=Botryobasidium botryosum (strain FD-172 SS1) TaxID=930990 RepID=A0A067N830_BOTB1|nr:hypothetical protein BOTBODRAFT_392526 [Botryobasidium botryosum FD-172 SS1]
MPVRSSTTPAPFRDSPPPPMPVRSSTIPAPFRDSPTPPLLFAPAPSAPAPLPHVEFGVHSLRGKLYAADREAAGSTSHRSRSRSSPSDRSIPSPRAESLPSLGHGGSKAASDRRPVTGVEYQFGNGHTHGHEYTHAQAHGHGHGKTSTDNPLEGNRVWFSQ